MTDTEMSLGETADDIRDVTPATAMTPEGFDLQAWIAGARPSRRATTVFARPDLLASIDVLSERVAVARAAEDTAEVATLVAQIRDLRDQLAASALDVVVEATSEKVRADLREALGIKEGEPVTQEQTIGFLAAHIVEPSGFDAEMLARFTEVSPTQVAKIAAAVRVANDTAPAIPAPFSSASSNGRRVRG